MYINLLDIQFCEKEEIQRLFTFLGNLMDILKIVIPIIIVIIGSVDLVKAVVAQKDDEIKKGYLVLLKRIIIGVVIFFIPGVVNLILNMANGDSVNKNMCMSCFSTPNSCKSYSSGSGAAKNSNSTGSLCSTFNNNKSGCENNGCKYTNANKCVKTQ